MTVTAASVAKSASVTTVSVKLVNSSPKDALFIAVPVNVAIKPGLQTRSCTTVFPVPDFLLAT